MLEPIGPIHLPLNPMQELNSNVSSEQDHQILEELHDLFHTQPPAVLRRNMEELYHAYLAEPNAVLPSKDIAISFYFLIRFLNTAEELNSRPYIT